MKKIISLILITGVLLVMVGCGSKQASKTKTEEELKAELRAEIEKEMKENEESDVNDKDVKDEDNNESKEKETSKKEDTTNKNNSLKTFNDVYNGDINIALDYFNNNLSKFSEKEKENFSKSLIELVIKEGKKFESYNFEDLPTTYQPMYPTLDSELYDYYDFETKEFNIGYFKGKYNDYYKKFKEIKNSKIFTLAASCWIDYGNVDLPAFDVTIKKDVYLKLKPALDLVPIEYSDLEMDIPNLLFKDVDYSEQISSENIIVDNFNELKSFEKKDTWKSNAIMYVIFVDKEVVQKEEKEEPKPIPSYGYENCVVRGIEYIDGGSLVLKNESIDYKTDYSFTDSLAIFGTITDVTLSATRLETDSGESQIKSYGTLTNIYLNFDVLDKSYIYWFDFVAQGKKQRIALVDSELENYVKDFAGEALTNIIYYTDKSNVPEPVVNDQPKFKPETIRGENIDFNKCTAVVVPFYNNGINYSEFGPIEELSVHVSGNSKNEVNFAVFGKMTDVTITGIESMDDAGESKHFDEISDKLVRVHCRLTTDMSTVRVTGYVHTKIEEFKVEFNLDDMRDESQYPILKY
jgi:hypothetical protein